MICAVRMVKGMQGIVFVHTELPGGNKNRAAGS